MTLTKHFIFLALTLLISQTSFAIAVGDQYLYYCQSQNPNAANGWDLEYEKAVVQSIDQTNGTYTILDNWYGPNDFTNLESSTVNGPVKIDGSDSFYNTRLSAAQIVSDCAGSGGVKDSVLVTGASIQACKIANLSGGYVWLTNHDFGGFGPINSIKFTALKTNPNNMASCELLNIIPAKTVK